MISQIAQDVGEKTLLSRTGGAPTWQLAWHTSCPVCSVAAF
jgi:hypothetical protein